MVPIQQLAAELFAQFAIEPHTTAMAGSIWQMELVPLQFPIAPNHVVVSANDSSLEWLK